MATTVCPLTLEEMEEEESFSLVWRPLVNRFSQDPEMIYWVPPLYSSHSLRSQESLALKSSSSTTLERRKHHSSDQEEYSALPTELELTDASNALEDSLNSEDSSHLYETINFPLRPQGSPGSFSAANESRVEQNYFFCEQEKTPEEEPRHQGFISPPTERRENEGVCYSCTSKADNPDSKSLFEDYSAIQNVRQRQTSSSSSTPQNHDTGPNECKMQTFSKQGRCRFIDDPEALHCWAASNLHSQATLHLDGEEIYTSLDKLSSEQTCCRCHRNDQFTQGDDTYNLNKCLYIMSVAMILLIGFAVMIVVIFSAR